MNDDQRVEAVIARCVCTAIVVLFVLIAWAIYADNQTSIECIKAGLHQNDGGKWVK